jgi:hypothetical protein
VAWDRRVKPGDDGLTTVVMRGLDPRIRCAIARPDRDHRKNLLSRGAVCLDDPAEFARLGL